jgi:hypothetical protein
MRAVLLAPLLVLASALAGCTQADTQTETPPPVSTECRHTYPDGSAFDCLNSTIIPSTVASQAPAPGSGWICNSNYDDDSTQLGFFRTFVHQDGRLGVYWEFKMPREGGFAFVQASLYDDKGTHALAVPFQDKGFMIFPDKPSGSPVELHILLRHFLLDVKEDGVWKPAENASVVLGRHAGEAYYVWRYETKLGLQALDIMVHSPDSETKREYQPQKRHMKAPDHEVYATVWNKGVKYSSYSMTPSPAYTYGCNGILT